MRTVCCWIAAILLLCPAAQAKTYAASFPNRSEDALFFSDEHTEFLFNDSGEILVPPGTYEWLYAIDAENGWFGAHLWPGTEDSPDTNRILLLNSDGQPVSDAVYDELAAGTADRLIFSNAETRFCGLIDGEGNVILPPTYTILLPDSEGGFIGMDDYVAHKFIGIPVRLDADGNVLRRSEYKSPWDHGTVDYHLYPAHHPRTGRLGYVDRDFQWVIEPQFKKARHFLIGEEFARVGDENDRYGLIDRSGNIVIPMQYYGNLEVTPFYIIGEQVGTGITDVYTRSCRLLFSWEGSVHSRAQLLVGMRSDAGRMYLLDAGGNVLSEADYADGYFDYEGDIYDPIYVFRTADGKTAWLLNDDYSVSTTPLHAAFSQNGESFQSLQKVKGSHHLYQFERAEDYGIVTADGEILISIPRYAELMD